MRKKNKPLSSEWSNYIYESGVCLVRVRSSRVGPESAASVPLNRRRGLIVSGTESKEEERVEESSEMILYRKLKLEKFRFMRDNDIQK